MSLNPLTPVTDYQSMLNRIFWFTSLAALVAVGMLRSRLPLLEAGLAQIDFSLAFGGDQILPVPGGYLLPALAVGLGSRIFRIHNLLANWLEIRERFDTDVIIRELALRTGVDLEGVPKETLADYRHEIMRRGFYQYVGGTTPQIDSQLIHRALDCWSWFWIGLEATFVFVATSFALVSTGNYQPGCTLLGCALAGAAIGLPLIRNECRRYAIAQVRTIIAEPMRAEQVRRVFDVLGGSYIVPRRAA